jgi:Fic family protein
VPPLVVWAALSLDFLCIHPFRDGNGRVSRLLLLLSLYRMGFTAGRYISLERIIERSKARYYDTLQQSSEGRHEGKHELWPHTNYLLFTLKELYAEFERRVGEMAAPRGEKSEVVLAAIQRRTGAFALAEIEKECPGVGRDWIRVILFQLKKEGRIACSGMGKAARWKHLP